MLRDVILQDIKPNNGDMMEILKINNLNKRFLAAGAQQVYAVNGVSFSINEGETLGLVGESGCGKTTVGRIIVNLEKPTSGKIFFEGQDISLFEKKSKRLRKNVQIVFQDPYDSLNPRKTVMEIISEPLRLMKEVTKDQKRSRVVEILNLVELDSSYLNKYPFQLTQGERQRIGVARAFVTNPKLVVLDEPTSVLDVRFCNEIVFLLKRLQEDTSCSYLFISHDLNVVNRLSHNVAVMYLGRIVEYGNVDVIFNYPKHPYTKALLEATLFPDPDQIREDFHLSGEVPSPVDLPDDRCNFATRCPIAGDICLTKLPELINVDTSHKVACIKSD